MAAAIDRTNPHGIALFDFDGQNPNELTFTAGAAIDLIDRVDSEWLRGNVGSEEGIFPASFVEIIIDIPECESLFILNVFDNMYCIWE